MGTLPPLHFLNETVFERTASEREDQEKIISHTAAQRSDLISGVYEGGLKVWECTYDLLELVERDGETFGGKRVLDLGCGAGLLGILALKRGARQVTFQDYNGTVIEQLTLPNVLLNCQEEEEESEEEDDEEGKGKRKKGDECKKKAIDEEKQEGMAGDPTPPTREDNFQKQAKDEEKREGMAGDPTPPTREDYFKKQAKHEEGGDGDQPPKKRALDPSQHSLLTRCRFFSGDWTTFLVLVLKETPSPKYDIIFTSETIYNTAYYPALHETLHRLLAPGGLVYLATKAHYFGVGGGLHLFEKFVEERGIFSMERLWGVEEGLQRHVVGLRFNTASKTS